MNKQFLSFCILEFCCTIKVNELVIKFCLQQLLLSLSNKELTMKCRKTFFYISIYYHCSKFVFDPHFLYRFNKWEFIFVQCIFCNGIKTIKTAEHGILFIDKNIQNLRAHKTMLVGILFNQIVKHAVDEFQNKKLTLVLLLYVHSHFLVTKFH